MDDGPALHWCGHRSIAAKTRVPAVETTSRRANNRALRFIDAFNHYGESFSRASMTSVTNPCDLMSTDSLNIEATLAQSAQSGVVLLGLLLHLLNHLLDFLAFWIARIRR